MKFGARLNPSVPPMTPGTKVGICVGVADIGNQKTTYKGKTNYKEQLLVTIEFPYEKIDMNGEMKPRQLSKRFSRTDDEKGAFTKTVSAWFAKNFTKEDIKSFDTDDLLLRPCMVTVSLSESGYANIDNIVQYPEGMPLPVTETIPFNFDMDKWSDEVFANLPEWLQNTIKNSTQYQKLHAPETTVEVKTTPAAEEGCPI